VASLAGAAYKRACGFIYGWAARTTQQTGEFPMMKTFVALSLAAMISPAFAAKSCDELKSEIDAKIKGHGVATFTLDVLASADVKEQKVVGTCEGGTKKVVYTKG
jgi:hypothetical protein